MQCYIYIIQINISRESVLKYYANVYVCSYIYMICRTIDNDYMYIFATHNMYT